MMTVVRTDPATESCRLCSAESTFVAETTILGSYPARLYQCRSCGYAQFSSPNWLEVAYGEAITATDLGLLRRCIRSSRRIRGMLAAAGVVRRPVLDWGGGYGTLTRMLRDEGVDCRHWDPHCPNLFARGFEATPDKGPWGAIIALEVLEHLPDPWAFLSQATACSDLVIFSTDVISEPAPSFEWNYFGTEHGQHVGFMSRRSLKLVARRTGMSLSSSGSLHVLHRGLGPFRQAALRCSPVRRIVNVCTRLESRLGPDFLSAKSRVETPADSSGF